MSSIPENNSNCAHKIYYAKNMCIKVTLSTLIIFYSIFSFSQNIKMFMVTGHSDLIKTDIDGIFRKAQTTIEVNYFAHKRFAFTAGCELNIHKNFSEMNAAGGFRFYPIAKVFVRSRIMRRFDESINGIGRNKSIRDYEVASGLGWSQPFNNSWRIEIIGDYYSVVNAFAVKAGVGYMFGKKKN